MGAPHPPEAAPPPTASPTGPSPFQPLRPWRPVLGCHGHISPSGGPDPTCRLPRAHNPAPGTQQDQLPGWGQQRPISGWATPGSAVRSRPDMERRRCLLQPANSAASLTATAKAFVVPPCWFGSPIKTPLAVTVIARSKAGSGRGGCLAPGPPLVAGDSCSSVKCSLQSSVFSILLFVFFPPACLSADSHATHGIINKSAAARNQQTQCWPASHQKPRCSPRDS